MSLSAIPRVSLAHLPTPLEPLPRLSSFLGGPAIYIRRDDQTGLALGGNKARKLEFLVADALVQGCDTLVTTGGVQSNHARQTAAAAARAGMQCVLLLPRLVEGRSAAYDTSGNVLLDRLLGAEVRMLPKKSYKAETFEAAIISTCATRGANLISFLLAVRRRWVRSVMSWPPTSCSRSRAAGIEPSTIVVATGSAGTHAGIVAGLAAVGHPAQVIGISISGTAAEREPLVAQLARESLALANCTIPDQAAIAARVRVLDGYVGAAYGQPTEGMIEAVRLVARLEGILLDPVYTGKAMAGLIDLVRRRRDFFRPNGGLLAHRRLGGALCLRGDFLSSHGKRRSLKRQAREGGVEISAPRRCLRFPGEATTRTVGRPALAHVGVRKTIDQDGIADIVVRLAHSQEAAQAHRADLRTIRRPACTSGGSIRTAFPSPRAGSADCCWISAIMRRPS